MSENNSQVSDLRSLPSDLRNPASDFRPPTSDLRPPSGSAQRLPHPVRITEQVWPEGTVPVVSVFCITYNHVNFIRDAIEGFLMQETTFPVEIFIHDDASTDGTAEIVKEYAEKYPKLFWTVLQTENQWSKGNPNAYFFGLMKKQRGEFIALCEGDDYWICKEKLQRQLEIMQKEDAAMLCFHNTWVMHPSCSSKDFFLNHGNQKKIFDLKYILSSQWFIATSSILVRKSALEGGGAFNFSRSGDIVIHALAASRGVIVFLDDVCSVYRRHENGVAYNWHKNNKFNKEKMRPNHFWTYFLISSLDSNKERQFEFKTCLERIIIEVVSYYIEEIDILENISEKKIQDNVFQCFESENPKKHDLNLYSVVSAGKITELIRGELEEKYRRGILKSLWDKQPIIALQLSFKSFRSNILSCHKVTLIYFEFVKRFLASKIFSSKHECHSSQPPILNRVDF